MREGRERGNEVMAERKRGEGEDILGPALERRPARDAVAIMEPDECGLEGEVFCMALAACLVARKTLREVRFDRLAAEKHCGRSFFSWRIGEGRGGEFRLPEHVRPHRFHELLLLNVCKIPHRS